jgi:peptide-methionine (S)-S-oxide reductase
VSVSGAPDLFRAVGDGDVARVRQLLAGGANPRQWYRGETALHAAARHGTLAMAEALIEGGALEWQTDSRGKTPLDAARRNRTEERAAIVALLDRSTISDPTFRAAVDAIDAGDVARLAHLLDAEPRLLHERILGPEAYRLAKRHQYFRDPKLFWFVANNPTRVTRMPANITEVARAMIERGVEQADLDYALVLVMTSSVAREQCHQRPLMRVLLAAGAMPNADTIASAAAHFELDALRALLEAAVPMTAPMAAALGENDALRGLIANADRDEVAAAFGLAAINGQAEALGIALDAGADVNAYLPVHSHTTALHQAALLDRADLARLLLDRGANPEAKDKLWDGTPLGWAIHENKPAARAVLETSTETPA